MEKQLLIDWIGSMQFAPGILNESSYQQNGRLVVPCTLQRANAKNQNERNYPKHILVREANKYLNSFIKEGRAGGELDHPESSVVSLKNASHRIIDLWWEGNTLKGKLEVSNTPNGHILESLLKDGWKVGISSRGLGSVENTDKGNIVQDDYELIAWDVVSNPSTHGAFLGAINENVEYTSEQMNDQKINQLIHDILKNI